MKHVLNIILFAIMLGLASCSADEPQNPQKDYTNYDCIEVIFNDAVLTEHPNIKYWNTRYNLEDDFILDWYKKYFEYSTLTFKNNDDILFDSFWGQETMYGVKQADNITISFSRRSWENDYKGKILMKDIGNNIYDCEVTDSEIKITFNVTLIYKAQTD